MSSGAHNPEKTQGTMQVPRFIKADWLAYPRRDHEIHGNDLAFSISEDFVTHGLLPPDGNPIISDGDLLGAGCVICARNADLLSGFDVNMDLGLDAVDVIDLATHIIVFSTELDSSNVGQFTNGDLLTTNGVIIPNQALTYKLNNAVIPYDLGLDGIHFVGEMEYIIAFLWEAPSFPREHWIINPGFLISKLDQFSIDIWFSTEGTHTPDSTPSLLDGDLLSTRYGTKIATNDLLLPASVPAGIPDRGVDFGLDAITNNRSSEPASIHFSTEIPFTGATSFSDSDVLRYGYGAILSHQELIGCFAPKAGMLGLDALSMRSFPSFTIYLPLVFYFNY